MFLRRVLHRVHLLHILRDNDASDRVLVERNAYRTIDRMSHRRRRRNRRAIFAGHILEQRLKIDFLLILRAHRGRCRLTDDGDHRLVVHLGIVEAIQKMNGTGSRRREANSHFTGELGVSTGHEGRKFLMSSLYKPRIVLCFSQCRSDSTDSITGIAVDSRHTPSRQTLH